MPYSDLAPLLDSTKKRNLKVNVGGQSVLIDGQKFHPKTPVSELESIFKEDDPALLLEIVKYQQRAVSELIDSAREVKPVDLDEIYLTHTDRFPYNETCVLICPKSYKHLILVNQSTEDFQIVHKSYFKESISLPKGVRPDYVDITEVYEPRLPSRFHELDEGQRKKFPDFGDAVWNNYMPPEYMSLPDTSAKCPPLLVKFFKHLFPDPAPRKHVLQWLTTLVSDYDSTLPILVLCGKAAIGKNTLVESIMIGLVGMSNYHKAAQLSERFNSSVANCTLHFSDEGEVDGIIKRNLKGFHELFVAIERKGVDVIDPERIYARFVVATNNRRDLKFDYNDRKFSVPELTDVKLLDAFTEEEVEWLFAFKDDPESQRRFYSYLVTTFRSTREAYHGPLFDRICYESLPAWFRSFLTMCEDGEEFSFTSFRKRSSVRNLAVDTLLHEIEQYEHQLGKQVVSHHYEDGVDFFTPMGASDGQEL